MKSIYNNTLTDWEQYFISRDEKSFKAIQIFDWLYKKRVTSFDEMTNLKKSVLEQLTQEFQFDKLVIVDKKEDADVVKYLFSLADDQKIEAVLMKHDYGNSLCISTQIGCNMGCAFCESGRLKKRRNLEVSEMILQILTVEQDLQLRLSHVVLMGIGEPFDNYENVISFIDIINSGKGIDLGSRHITVSTCGIVPRIDQFSDDGKQVNLAISLHAANDTLRSKLMPINKVYPLNDLIASLNRYIKKTNRRVTFEYILLKGINDQPEHAFELCKLVKGMNCYINLIPYNETTHLSFQKTNQDQILAFYDILKKHHIQVVIRREFGGKLMAACGQLRSHYEEGH